MNVIVDMLVYINYRLNVAKEDNVFRMIGHGNYYFNDRELLEWFNKTRLEILGNLFSICEEVGINNDLHFPKERCRL